MTTPGPRNLISVKRFLSEYHYPWTPKTNKAIYTAITDWRVLAYYVPVLQPSHTRLKNRVVIKKCIVKPDTRLFPSRPGVISYTLKEKYSLIHVPAGNLLVHAKTITRQFGTSEYK